jgi:hypothetical protein
VSARNDRPTRLGGVQDDTADLGAPMHPSPYPYPGEDDLDDQHADTPHAIRDRLRPTKRVRQVHGTAVSACYAGTLATFAWLLGEAFLHLNALIMLISVALLTWLVPDAHRVWRWLRTGRANGEAVPMSWSVQLVVTAITALNLFLLIYAHL